MNDKSLVHEWYLSQLKVASSRGSRSNFPTHDGLYLLDQDTSVASAVLAPADTKETRIIVKWVNNHKIPIFLI